MLSWWWQNSWFLCSWASWPISKKQNLKVRRFWIKLYMVRIALTNYALVFMYQHSWDKVLEALADVFEWSL